ncbi:large exoprotein [Microbacterium sp. NPDC058269]|uniref:large exoprotein n=1 Tax=Microbacterium sp. NPDC058269 TaxID=3346414 RepID=UPI0036D892EC
MDDYYGYGGLSGGALVALILVYTILPLAIYALYSWFYMKIFEKAGVQGKWRAWVPVYSTMIFYKLGDLSPWLVLYLIGAGIVGSIIPFLGWFLILPLVGIAGRVVDLIAAWRVGLKLQKDAVWVVLYFFLPPVWLGINAFDKSRWNPAIQPASWAANGLLGDRTVWDGVPAQASAAAPQAGYGAPQGYAPPAPQGYAPPAQPGYAPPAQPGYAPPAGPAAPATGAPVPPVPPTTPPAPPAAPPTTPPAPPTAPPAAPPAPPAAPPAPPAAPPAPPTDPTQPPA